MLNQLATVQLAVHRRRSPQGGSIEEFGIEFHVGDEHTRSMTGQLADDQAVGTDSEASPTRRASGAVVRADPKMILGRSALHGRGDDRFPDVVFWVGRDPRPAHIKRIDL